MQIEITPEYLASQGLSPTFPERFWAKVHKLGPMPLNGHWIGRCWNWKACLHEYGYGKIGSTAPKTILAHVASWILHYGPIPPGMFVCHVCDFPPCSRPDHLFLGTQKDNIVDMWKKGRANHAIGERCFNSILTAGKVLEIRSRAIGGERNDSMALEYGVSERAIRSVVNLETWKHV